MHPVIQPRGNLVRQWTDFELFRYLWGKKEFNISSELFVRSSVITRQYVSYFVFFAREPLAEVAYPVVGDQQCKTSC